MHANAQITNQNYQLALQRYRLAAGDGLVPALAHEAATKDLVRGTAMDIASPAFNDLKIRRLLPM